MCRLSGLSRASLQRRPQPQSEWETSARDGLREVALEFSAYGYRRLLAELKRRGWRVGERRVRRWMREAGLSRPRKRPTKRTTDSNHALTVYPNLARTLTLSAPDQLWAADITYVRLLREFVYAAVILDVFSRRALGWAVGPTLGTELLLAAAATDLEEYTATGGSAERVRFPGKPWGGSRKCYGNSVTACRPMQKRWKGPAIPTATRSFSTSTDRFATLWRRGGRSSRWTRRRRSGSATIAMGGGNGSPKELPRG